MNRYYRGIEQSRLYHSRSGLISGRPGKERSPVVCVCPKSQHEKLLDDPEALLYCDPEFDLHFDLSLS